MESYFSTLKTHSLEIYDAICAWCVIKIPVSFILSMLTYLIGDANHAAVQALFILLIFDFITALMAKFHIGEQIESRKALKSATKVAVYGIFVSSAHLTESILPGVTFPYNVTIDLVAISFLALTEMISIIENIGKMGYAIPKKLLNVLESARDSK